MNLPPLILASASPRREQLLREAGVEFQVLAGGGPEVQPDFLTPHEAVQINAYRKARVIAKQHPDCLVLGADTEVCLGRKVFGKPKDMADAQRMLGALQGRTHEVVTGVCLLHLRSHRQKAFAVSTTVTFRRLDAPAIERYLKRVNPLDKAGAYAIQHHGEMIVERLDGSFSNVVGLPVAEVMEELAGWGGVKRKG